MRKIVYAVLVAVMLAAVAADARVAGVEVWKWLLAAVGLAFFVAGGRRRT